MGLNKSVDFSTAKLLKEKGFDEPTYYCYNLDGTDKSIDGLWSQSCEGGMSLEDWLVTYNSPHFNLVAKPTIAAVINWLYEKHGIWIFILPQDKSSIDYRVESSKFPSLPLFVLILRYESNMSMTEILNSSDPNSKIFLHFDTPTDGYEFAIKHILENLI